MQPAYTIKITGLLFFFIAAGWSLIPGESAGQFLRITFDIDTELETEEIQSLSFGEVIPNAGQIHIAPGDPNMGIYAISGLQNLMVDLTLDLPQYLIIRGSDQGFRVPVDLSVSYANRNENNLDHAVEIEGSHVRFPLRDHMPSATDPVPSVSTATAFLFVYGTIKVGDIPPGTYDADVFLVIEYE